MLIKKKRKLLDYRPRTWKASARDISLLIKEFRSSVLFFTITIVGLGFIYFFTALKQNEPVNSIAEAVYLMLTLTFLQPSGIFPRNLFLQTLFFIMPLLGVATLARGLADFGIMLFNRRARSKEWEMVSAGYMIGVLGGPEQLGRLLHDNE
jgi:voltage-gated potassium channel